MSSFKAALLCLLLAFPMFAHAGCNCELDQEDEVYETAEVSYNYMGLKGGTGFIKTPFVPVGSAAGFGIYAGSRLDNNLAFEVDYTETGVFQTQTGTASSVIYSIFSLHQIAIGRLDLFGKLGLSNASTVQNTALTATNVTNAMLNISYGVGTEIALGKSMGFRVTYDRYRVNLVKILDNDFFAAGLTYKF